jgi:hypothetical protein
VPNAWHFAFIDSPSTPIPSEDGDLAANPPGFDRKAFLDGLSRDLAAFFDKRFGKLPKANRVPPQRDRDLLRRTRQCLQTSLARLAWPEQRA